ncbi:MAG TPA: hypothetical protein VJ789_01120 [Burkholderiales bacterium]|nr:hypothetical protein [Burkholderiales bacterium]
MGVRVLLALAILIPGLATAQEPPAAAPAPAAVPPASEAPRIRLKNHEPIFAGYTWDSDDVGFLDFTISLQYPILAKTLDEGKRYGWLPYFALTARFGQYVETRESSPVIAKRFNPKFFVRYALSEFPDSGESPDRYLDFEYAHESNGQSVDTQQSFDSLAQALGSAEYAKDYISRGWDYLGLTWKHTLRWEPTSLRMYVSRKWYCGCWLQGDMEESFDFEEPREITSIRQVSGWRAVLALDTGRDNPIVDRATLILDTGTRDTFKYNTARLELGIPAVKNFTGVPLVLWARTGYLSDLAQYYQKVTSYGVAFELLTLGR